MNLAKKLVCSVAATTVLVSTVLTTAIPVFADVADPSHQHKYTKERYLVTEQDGSYTHRVVIGTDNNGNPVYGNCTVMVETEKYTWQCEYCYDTHGEFTRTVETHSYCR